MLHIYFCRSEALCDICDYHLSIAYPVRLYMQPSDCIHEYPHKVVDMAHQHSQGHPKDRSLRIATILAFLPTVGLLLPYGIISARPLPTVGIAAMFFSATFSTLVLGGKFQSSRAKAWIDLFLAISILALLIPRYVQLYLLCPVEYRMLIIPRSWIFLSRPHYSWKTDGRVVLGTYGTMPMILNW